MGGKKWVGVAPDFCPTFGPRLLPDGILNDWFWELRFRNEIYLELVAPNSSAPVQRSKKFDAIFAANVLFPMFDTDLSSIFFRKSQSRAAHSISKMGTVEHFPNNRFDIYCDMVNLGSVFVLDLHFLKELHDVRKAF